MHRTLLLPVIAVALLMFAGVSFAQDESVDETEAEMVRIYNCPMHPGEMSLDPEAVCPECEMKLEPMGELYYCPMFCDELLFDTDEKPCPVCSIELVKVEEVFVCPMHCDGMVYLDSEGECEICSMDLVPAKIDFTLKDEDTADVSVPS